MKIGELGRRVAVEPPTIRYYEAVGVLPEPARTEAGYRYYTPDDVDRLRFIKSARSLGIALDDIREILTLRQRGEAPCSYVRGVIDRQVEAVGVKLAELEDLSKELRRLQELARSLADTPGDDPCVCHILDSSRHRPARRATAEEAAR